MKFSEAMAALEAGKKVRLPEWPESQYIHMQKYWIKNEKLNDCDIDCSWVKDNWQLYEEPIKMYSFDQVIPFFKKGCQIKRKKWDCWYVLPNSYNYVFKFVSEDILATDWIVMEDKC